MKVLCFWMMITIAAVHAAEFNIKHYGAKANGKSDDSQAIEKAWNDACKCKRASKLLIPQGTYMVGPIKFVGPCQGPITVQAIRATFKAPTNPSDFKSQNSWIVFENLNGLRITGGTFDGQGKFSWSKNTCTKTEKCYSMPISLSFNKLSNSVIDGITSLNSKLFHINILNCKNIIFQHTTIHAPEHTPNTDGIHIGRSNGVKIIGADIKTGDDCISLGDGSQQVSIENVNCGPGHGIAIGSLGKYVKEEPVIGVGVKNCTIANTMFGLRVKTWPASPSAGIARDLHFEDIVMNNVNSPILIDQQYCPYGQCNTKVPSRVGISNVSFKNIRGTSATQCALKLICSPGIPCQEVELSDRHLAYHGNEGKATSECSNVKPKLTGHHFPIACA